MIHLPPEVNWSYAYCMWPRFNCIHSKVIHWPWKVRWRRWKLWGWGGPPREESTLSLELKGMQQRWKISPSSPGDCARTPLQHLSLLNSRIRILYAAPSSGAWGEHELDYILTLRSEWVYYFWLKLYIVLPILCSAKRIKVVSRATLQRF